MTLSRYLETKRSVIGAWASAHHPDFYCENIHWLLTASEFLYFLLLPLDVVMCWHDHVMCDCLTHDDSVLLMFQLVCPTSPYSPACLSVTVLCVCVCLCLSVCLCKNILLETNCHVKNLEKLSFLGVFMGLFAHTHTHTYTRKAAHTRW